MGGSKDESVVKLHGKQEIIMDEVAGKALKLLREIKSVTFATINGEELSTRIIDVGPVEKDALYFLTTKGKPFYWQLKSNPSVTICGMDDNYVSVRPVVDLKFCEDKLVADKILDLNPMMKDLYSSENRYVPEGIHLHNGEAKTPAEVYLEMSWLRKAAKIMGYRRTTSLGLKFNKRQF